jgi:hypothetical protein
MSAEQISAELARQNRLYGMMQFLLTHAGQGTAPAEPPPREIVQQHDARAAVLMLATAIDQHAQAGTFPVDQALFMAEMLMLIRDFIQPLPPGVAEEDGPDLVDADLRTAVAEMREMAQAAGFDV